MSETFFPVNDLLRRRTQTLLVVSTLASIVASAIFLLHLGESLRHMTSQTGLGSLSAGISVVLTDFVHFTCILIFAIEAVVASFVTNLMMSQRSGDIGLMRAAGCPNDLVFGYFVTELAIVILGSSLLGVVLGLVMHWVSTSLCGLLGFHVIQGSINPLLIILVVGVFLTVDIALGLKPIFDSSRADPLKAISPASRFGLTGVLGFRAIPRRNLRTKIALRSIFRRKSATIQVILCLSMAFMVATISVAGGVIANQTTSSWIEGAVGRDLSMIAHQDIYYQYESMLKIPGDTQPTTEGSFRNEEHLVPNQIVLELKSRYGITQTDTRLVLRTLVRELPAIVLGEGTSSTRLVGDQREGEALVVGVDPESVYSEWFLEGRFLHEGREAVIGDSLAQSLFTLPINQSLLAFNTTFDITGVCIDPVNNGNVTYVPLDLLSNATGIRGFNVVMFEVRSPNRDHLLDQIKSDLSETYPEFGVFELNDVLEDNLDFLGGVWSTIMLLPLFVLATISLVLVGYVFLVVADQHQDFGIVRALGSRPRDIFRMISEQIFLILVSGLGFGLPIGIMTTLLILIPDPVITETMILQISAWLMLGLSVVFALGLIPALRFSRKPVREMISQP